MAQYCPEGCPLATRLSVNRGSGNPPCNRQPTQECLDYLTQLGGAGSLDTGISMSSKRPEVLRKKVGRGIAGNIANFARRVTRR